MSRSENIRRNYDALVAEKAALERTICRRQESIKKLVQDIQVLYQVNAIRFLQFIMI